jgi:ABC-type glycerol-3-phosphate transport system substrate-binding protein
VIGTAQPEQTTIRLWVPPQFDPAGDNPAARLFQARLDEYIDLNPGVQVEVRVKAATGTGGILASLTATNAAAPLAVPDLVALRREDLESAAIKGLVIPLDGLTTAFEDPDWLAYAIELSSIEENLFGLPFAGDGMIMIYRPSQIGDPPADLATALQLGEVLTFPAASPRALFPLALYLASGGQIEDAEQRPILDAPQLTRVLTFFQEAEQVGLLPFWLTQYESFPQALDAFRDNRAQMAISWASTFLADPPIDTVAAVLPTLDGTPYTIADGWVWALTSPHEEHQVASLLLAEFLTDSKFLTSWSQAGGYLPTRPSSLEGWPASPLRDLIVQFTESARIIPSTDVLTTIGPTLQEATILVLKQEEDPAVAAQLAKDKVNPP